MKTKNNVQKTILRSGAVIISFVLISFTVSAQEFWKNLLTHSSFNEIAIAMIENEEINDAPAKTEAKSDFQFYAIQDYDNELNLEDWMTADFYNGFQFYQLTTESKMELENWMLNDRLFENANEENAMELQAWMTSDEVWKI